MPERGFRVLVVDDEAVAARRVFRLLHDHFPRAGLEVVEVSSFADAVGALSSGAFDLMCLDLNLSGSDGFEILARADCPPVIVVSAHIGRAIEAFDHHVVDFVGKPVEVERFRLALKRFELRGGGQAKDRTLALQCSRGIELVRVAAIVCVSGADDYVEVFATEGRRYLDSRRLGEFVNLDTKLFVRVHRSHVVNLKFIRRLERRSVLILEGGHEIPVSRGGLQILKNAGLV